jgi:hypothetical protein
MKTNDELVSDIVTAIDEALRMFGQYTMHDKGAHEVMFVEELVEPLRRMLAVDVSAILSSVLDRRGDDAEPFVTAVLLNLQDMPDDWFNQLLVDPRVGGLY